MEKRIISDEEFLRDETDDEAEDEEETLADDDDQYDPDNDI